MTTAKTKAAVAAGDQGLFILFAQLDDNFERGNVANGEEMLSLLASAVNIDARIIATRARTPAGIARKVKEVLAVMDRQEDEDDCWYRRMLRSVLADLVAMEERLAG